MVNKNSLIPVYKQIAETLKSEILGSLYPDGGNIGTHTQLAERFGVSLISVRKAIQLLSDEKLVEVKQGKGTFVHTPEIHENLVSLTGVANLLSRSKISAKTEVRLFELVSTDLFKLSPDVLAGLGGLCLHVLRFHTVENTVTAIAEIFLPSAYGAQLAVSDVEQSTIYQLYKNKLGVELGRGRQRINVIRADEKLASEFSVEPGYPLVQINRCAYDKKGKLIEYMKLLYAYKSYSIEVELDLSAE